MSIRLLKQASNWLITKNIRIIQIVAYKRGRTSEWQTLQEGFNVYLDRNVRKEILTEKSLFTKVYWKLWRYFWESFFFVFLINQQEILQIIFADETKNDNRSLKITKGSASCSLSRAFVDFIVNKLDVGIFIALFNQMYYGVDEMLFSTLHSNEQLGNQITISD